MGRLDGLPSLSRRCCCPAGFKHQQLVGKDRAEAAAEYPAELCSEYAKLLVKAWKRTLDLEWWQYQVANKRSEVSALQLKWWVEGKATASRATHLREESVDMDS